MVRSFGSVAAVAAAALALMIGFLAFSAHQNNQQANRPPGSQSPGLVSAHGGAQNGTYAAASPTGTRASSSAAGSSAAGEAGSVFVSAGGGINAASAAPQQASSCNPGLIQAVVGLLGALLGGSGAC